MNVFENMANQYDNEERIKLSKVIVDKIKTEFNKGNKQIILDYGTGTGLVGLSLLEFSKKLILIDSAKSMIDIVNKKISHINTAKENIECINTNLSEKVNLSKVHDKVDVVVMSLVLLHIPDTPKIIKNLYELLNKKGKIIIIDFEYNSKISHPLIHNGFKFNDLYKLFKEVGFKKIEINSFYTKDKIFMNQKATLFELTAQK